MESSNGQYAKHDIENPRKGQKERRSSMTKIALTGIKPTGTPHIGNYLGMIKPALELAQSFQAFYFIADYHALTTTRDRNQLNRCIYEVAATWLALGLDPERVVFYRQSDIAEVFEFAWILACFTSKGLLNRAHAYKAAVEENFRAGKSADDNINTGLYNYPVLMAADILLFGTDVVPVGLDQRQHLEIVRDIAVSVNAKLGKVLKVPQVLIRAEVMTIPGLDGRKMSKNYRNTIPIFADPGTIRRQVLRIVTDSKPPEQPKDPDECNVFAIWQHFAPAEAVEDKRQLYWQGGLAYSDIKQELCDLLIAKFDAGRQVYKNHIRDTRAIDRILKQGAEKARNIAEPMLATIRRKIGIE
jgi:tryptophanyl-tRNA synthetase